MEIKRGRVDSYCFTVKTKDDPALIKLRQKVKAQNRLVKDKANNLEPLTEADRLCRVLLMGRGPRTKNGKVLHSSAKSNLRHEHATHFDVYIQDHQEQSLINRAVRDNITLKEVKLQDEVNYLLWAIRRYVQFGDCYGREKY